MMQATRLAIPDVQLFQPAVFADERGHFFESFRSAWLPDVQFVQDNQSRSSQWTLRGLHYQRRQPQGKLVRALEGAVFDVAVDLRRASPHFGKWLARTLTGENKEILWVPPGFAHGFLALSASAVLAYKCTAYHAPEDECALRWDDPALGIDWPLAGQEPLLSAKDRAAPLLRDAPVFD